MGRNLIVNLFGIGNQIQLEPLMRVLGEGDVLVDLTRSVHELAPLFPRWRFVQFAPTDELIRVLPTVRMDYDDVYMGFPLDGRQFGPLGNRLHYPVWSFREWDRPLYSRYAEMADAAHVVSYFHDGFGVAMDANTPKLSVPDVSKLERTIAVSLGYWRGDGGAWAKKTWTTPRMAEAISSLVRRGWNMLLLGKAEDFAGMGMSFISNFPRASLIDQVGELAGCSGYLGNDTGFAHIAGALGLPSVVYTVEDKIKVRTAASKLLQFGPETSPEEAVDWLIQAIEGGEKVGREEGAHAQEGQADA